LNPWNDFEVCGEAENGRMGVELAVKLKPDLIILDLSMPVMDGLQAAREIRELMPAVPILMYTSFTNANLPAEALAAGVRKVATKPSPPEELVEDLRRGLSVDNDLVAAPVARVGCRSRHHDQSISVFLAGFAGLSRAGHGKLSPIPPEGIDFDVTYDIALEFERRLDCATRHSPKRFAPR
jgi:DNA-binding NarL/FixJ family response regulator